MKLSNTLLLAFALGSQLVSGAQAQNAVPHLNQPLVPQSGPPKTGLTLIVNGTGFVSGSIVEWNGSPKTTTFINGQQLSAAISALDDAVDGTATVAVQNPSGTTSNVGYFSITRQISFKPRNEPLNELEQRLEAADFNGDGKLDLVGALTGGAAVSVRLGSGDGTFQNEVRYSTAPGTSDVISGDFNGDGKLDIAVLCEPTPGGVVSVLLGNGDGTFQAHIDSPVDRNLHNFGFAAGDFNGDGKLDLVVGYQDPSSNSVSVLLGNGDGSFRAPVDYATANEPGAVAVGDFNGDGKLDIVTANFGVFGGNTVSVLIGNGDGTFQPHVEYTTSYGPLSVIAADFNGDGKLDLAVDCSCGTGPTCGFTGVVSILLGNGDGTFQSHVDYNALQFSYTVVAGDFDGDGVLDLAVANLDSSEMSVLPGLGNGTFSSALNFPAPFGGVGIAAGDFNNNGKLDIALATDTGFTLMLH